MDKILQELIENAEDILSTGRIIYSICKTDNCETALKIRPLAELISKKADKLCIKIAENIKE